MVHRCKDEQLNKQVTKTHSLMMMCQRMCKGREEITQVCRKERIACRDHGLHVGWWSLQDYLQNEKESP